MIRISVFGIAAVRVFAEKKNLSKLKIEQRIGHLFFTAGTLTPNAAIMAIVRVEIHRTNFLKHKIFYEKVAGGNFLS